VQWNWRERAPGRLRGVPLLDAGVVKETMPLRHDMRNAHGGVMAAPLCIACPEPYLGDDEAVPAPVIASLQILDDARDVARVDVLRELLGKGKRMAFSRSKVVDASDHRRVIAVSAGTGVSLGEVPGGYERTENPPIPVVDSPDMPRLHQVFRAVKSSDGLWRLPPLSREQSAPHAALHSGPSTSSSRWPPWRRRRRRPAPTGSRWRAGS
jgi:hypothetical protein